MINLLLSLESSETLSTLLRGNWERFWVQGGKFDFLRPVAESVFTIPTLVIDGLSIVEIGAFSVDLDDGTEVFPLSLRTFLEIGAGDSERQNRPPRKPVSVFPSDLNLRPFLHSEVTGGILIDENSGNPIVDGIVFEQGTNILLVASSYDLPESIIVTTRKDYVDSVLKRRIRKAVLNS